MSRRFPFHTLVLVQAAPDRLNQYMAWYTAQSRNRWKVLVSPEDHRAALEGNPLVAAGTTDPVTHYGTVMVIRKDQYQGQVLNPPNFAELHQISLFGENELPSYTQKLIELGLEPKPFEEPA